MTHNRVRKPTLMLVDDPEITLQTLCKFRDQEVDKRIFTSMYEQIAQKTVPIRDKNADCHFYTLTSFKFLTSTGIKGMYKLSHIGYKICSLQNDPNNLKEFQNVLSQLLLQNEKKGQLFKDFLEFLTIPKTQYEIFLEFKRFTGITLIAWSKLAGLIVEYDGQYQAIPITNELINKIKFEKALIKTYHELEKGDKSGHKRLVIPIGEMRFIICVELGINKENFDEMLRNYLESKEYGRDFELFGAPVNVFIEKIPFEFRNKLYIYLSLK